MKPLALTVADARAMVDACKKAGVIMATNHHLPVHPVHRAIKKMVQAGEIGDIRAIRFHHAVQLPARLAGWRIETKSEGGVVYDVTVHDAAAIAAILGTDLYIQIIREFNGAVAGRGKVHVDGEAGIRSLAVSVAVQEAIKTGNRILVF